MRKRTIWVAMVALVDVILGGCYPQAHISLFNGCEDVWFRVTWLEGQGTWNQYEKPLHTANRVLIPLSGVSSQRNKFVISLDGFHVGSNELYGSVARSIQVSSYGGEMTGPQNNYAWRTSCHDGHVQLIEDW